MKQKLKTLIINNRIAQSSLSVLIPVRSRLSRLYRQLGQSKLTASQQALLKLMRRDNAQAVAPFKPSAMWSELSRQFDKELRIQGIGRVETQFFNTLFSQSVPTNPRYYRYALWMLYCNVKQKDRHKILERVTTTANPDSGLVYVFEGKSVSWDLLITIDTLYSIAEVNEGIFTDPLVVVDLGAGWGRIGYVLKKLNPRCTYVCLDLPEPLLLSMTRLPQLLPEEKVFGYEDVRATERISKSLLSQGGLWFGGPQDLARFEDQTIDVFINIASFQEMLIDQVAAYFALIDKKVGGIFYTQQYWKETGLQSKYGVIGGLEDYPFGADWHRHYLRNSTFSERYFETALSINRA